VATKAPNGEFIIAAGEVGAFSVCPQAWKLKWIDQVPPDRAPSVDLGQKLHTDWSVLFEESLTLSTWVRYLVVMITCAAVVFLLIHPPEVPLSEVFFVSFHSHGLLLILLSVLTLWVIRAFSRAASKRHRESGFLISEVAVAMEGSSVVPAREYISVAQGLAGKPDALVREGDEVRPVERKPLAKKLRDRYVAQLMVYMRLVEEFEGTRPHCGYLILGPACRRVVVENTEAKQRWVEGMIGEMRRVLHGQAARATPHPAKCARCDVRSKCSFRANSQSVADSPPNA